MSDRIEIESLGVDRHLWSLVNEEILEGTGIEPAYFWKSFREFLERFSGENQRLLERREDFQRRIDEWYASFEGAVSPSPDETEKFLRGIGYLIEEGGDFEISPENVDEEISSIAGPQLVVPANNARFALNAANARWMSLYDAAYGTDLIESEPSQKKGFDATLGKKVVKTVNNFLDKIFPFEAGSFHQALGFQVVSGELYAEFSFGRAPLANPEQLVGHEETDGETSLMLLKNNGLHVEIHLNRDHPAGKLNAAGICDVVLESALTAIQDCEDSVAAVDGEDKTEVYRNWLGLCRGDLTVKFEKNGKMLTRAPNPDRTYKTPDGMPMTLRGRSLLLVRNVGHLMRNPAVLMPNGDEVFEGLMDAMITVLCAVHDLRKGVGANSPKGSVYVVKPKMHGPEEVDFANRVFSEVERILGLPENTVKIGVMDEERRTTLNLKECIRAVKNRVVFINTGFLDRTGDEVHTAMLAGPMQLKEKMKGEKWFSAYEDWNVEKGLRTGFSGRGQIGKGMWTMPDLMKPMFETKSAHLKAGANCSWVPSPTAACIHAMHYHLVDVFAVQEKLKESPKTMLSDLLTVPVASGSFSGAEVETNLLNNCQTILGYVVRWIDQGVGCSKVQDISGVALMEDRATLRISSQLLANWIRHGIIDEARFGEAMRKMAAIVDSQNEGDPNYVSLAAHPEGIAFQAAMDLVLLGLESPSGYTEPILHQRRLERKALLASEKKSEV